MSFPDKVSLSDLEKLTGSTYRTLKRRLQKLEPVEVTSTVILYDAKSALHAIFSSEQKDNLNLMQEKARWTKIQADKGLIELEKLREDVIDKHEFMKGWAEKVVACRSKLLSVALQTSGEVATCDDADIVYKIIAEKIEEALHEITT